MTTAAALTIERLTKRYGTLTAVDGVSMSLQPGEILGVIGPSGSGKTSLLRCVDLLENFDDGWIDFEGAARVSGGPEGLCVAGAGAAGDGGLRPLEEGELAEIRRRVGYVFQSLNLWENRTVLQNLILAPTVVNRERRGDASDRAATLAREFGVADKLAAWPWQLSGGQRQRVALIRALMMRPAVLLLDEITSALDPVLTVEVMHAVRKLRDSRMTMVAVTHHLQFASALCDRIAYMSDGRVVQVDAPDRLKAAPATPEIERFLQVLAEAR